MIPSTEHLPEPDRDAVLRWQRLRDVFDRAADAPADEWPALVARETEGDAELAGEVMRLLAAFERDATNLEHPDFGLGDGALSRLGEMVGPYRLERPLGEGGMGLVYLATRADGSYQQQVAIKFVRAALSGAALVERFRHERQILAALEHPNIARLLDGGVTARGEPYFVMEFVDGIPITRFADEHHLDITQRLQLMQQACAAVRHAHAKLVVHRDIKPANMLVTLDGTVKLLDFGVAKLLGAQDGTASTMTLPHSFTTEYAAPEQLRDEPAAVTSDIYSLGVVLYELLAGTRPWKVENRSAVAMLEAMRSPAPRLSAVAPAGLRRTLAGELDNIVARAIHLDVVQRYSSVEQLSADLHRYTAGMPVLAQPDSRAYRMRKFVQRNRAAVIGATSAVLALLIALGTVTWQSVRRAAEARYQSAVATASSLDELGNARLAAGDVPVADSLLAIAASLCTSDHRPDAQLPAACLRVLFDRGAAALWHGQPALAESWVARPLSVVRAAPGANHLILARLLSTLAQIRDWRGDLVAAESLFRASDAHFRAAGELRGGDRAEELGWFAVSLDRANRFRESDSVVQVQDSAVGAPDAVVMLHQAWLHAMLGDTARARGEAARSYQLRSAESAPGSLLAVRIGLTQGYIDLALGRRESALAELQRTRTAAAQRYRPTDARYAEVQQALGEALESEGRAMEARSQFDSAAATFRAQFGPSHPQTLRAVQSATRIGREINSSDGPP